MYTYKAHVLRVIDGDTAYVSVDLGFFLSMTIDVRFALINAPELKSSDSAERERANRAKARLVELIEGKDVFLKSQKKDKYGRWLGEFFLSQDSEVSVNKMMINEGLAVKY